MQLGHILKRMKIVQVGMAMAALVFVMGPAVEHTPAVGPERCPNGALCLFDEADYGGDFVCIHPYKESVRRVKLRKIDLCGPNSPTKFSKRMSSWVKQHSNRPAQFGSMP